MGLYQSCFRFDGAPPDLQEVRAEAERRLGGTTGIESLEAEGQTVVACSLLDPFTHPVVCAILQERGGKAVNVHDGEPDAMVVPVWAHSPISDLPWLERLAIRCRWLLSTAK